MPTVQNNFATDYAVGYPGMVANGETSNRISRSIEDAAGIAFGKAAFRGATDHGVTATPAAGTFMGIVIADHGIPLLPGNTADVFPQRANVPLMQRGSIWVRVGSLPVADGDGVAVLNADGSFVPVGTAASTPLLGWVFDDTAAAAGLARITNNRGVAV